jgi:hypothetical protein
MPGLQMSRQVPESTRSGGRATLGRLVGLSPNEADRGERALWLSGGGYRAALFHLGALTRLNELGLLAQIGTVGATAGGSIVAALLATRVPWPIHGSYDGWDERIAEPLRAIASRDAPARSVLRRPFPGDAGEAALEEHYARDLVLSLGGEPAAGPRFVFGASGLALSGLASGWKECLEWEVGGCAQPAGYGAAVVAAAIGQVHTDLNAFAATEQAVLENHGYLLADAGLQALRPAGPEEPDLPPALPPHPDWMGDAKVSDALGAGARRTLVGRLRRLPARKWERAG